MRLDGIHHISAITGDAPRNVDFYTRVLGLRMIAKTVNQDDPSVYHLFYGDEHARPGADLTFFEYPGAAPGRPGAGMVHRVVWRVGCIAALDFWEGRLAAEGVAVQGDAGGLRFADPEGLSHELVVASSSDPALIAEHPEVPAEHALQGFEGVRAYSFDPDGSAATLERLMGARRMGDVDRWELRGQRRGGWIAFDPAPAARGRQSAGVVHHVAFGTSDEDLPAWIQAVSDAGVPNSGYVDRHYFHSLYFREPGGVLYELATVEPGFTVDGPVGELGTRLILPPFLEPRREQIAARLTPLPDPRAGWPERERAAGDLAGGALEAGEPAAGEPAVGEPAVGEPAVGEPAVGEPGVGEPAARESAVREPGVGEPGVGEPGVGEPGVGEPATSGARS